MDGRPPRAAEVNTQTHVLLALALFSKRKSPSRNWAVFAGAMATDLFIYVGLVYYGLMSGDGRVVERIGHYFNAIYFQPHMQFWSALSNSLPIYAGLAIIGYILRKQKWAYLLLFFGLAAFSQSLIDLPVHADDAHRHFWPLSNWRFISPISYWDPAYYGRIVGQLDNLLGMICIAVLWRRFSARRVRIILSVFIGIYLILAASSAFGPALFGP